VSHVSLTELNEDKYSKAELFGKLGNTCGDLESHKILDTSAFKQIVSGDSIRAQRKYQNPFYFRNYDKLIFSSNHIPKVANEGYPWFKRVIPLPLLETFLDNKDVNKIEELTTPEELSGFLNLVLIALKQLIKDGNFAYVGDLREVEKLFQDMEKGVIDFVSERCIRSSSSLEICVDIYKDYCQYCKQKGLKPLSDNSFGVIIHEMGIQKSRIMIGGARKYMYRGIKLKSKSK
jgi:putative DNA primase/helicase